MVCFSNFIVLPILLVFYGLLPRYRKVSGFHIIQVSLCYCSYLFVFECITGLERENPFLSCPHLSKEDVQDLKKIGEIKNIF